MDLCPDVARPAQGKKERRLGIALAKAQTDRVRRLHEVTLFGKPKPDVIADVEKETPELAPARCLACRQSRSRIPDERVVVIRKALHPLYS
jgi:hypothetical protein